MKIRIENRSVVVSQLKTGSRTEHQGGPSHGFEGIGSLLELRYFRHRVVVERRLRIVRFLVGQLLNSAIRSAVRALGGRAPRKCGTWNLRLEPQQHVDEHVIRVQLDARLSS